MLESLLSKKKKQEITSVGENVLKGNTYALLVGTYIGTAAMENSMKFQKIKKFKYHMIQ